MRVLTTAFLLVLLVVCVDVAWSLRPATDSPDMAPQPPRRTPPESALNPDGSVNVIDRHHRGRRNAPPPLGPHAEINAAINRDDHTDGPSLHQSDVARAHKIAPEDITPTPMTMDAPDVPHQSPRSSRGKRTGMPNEPSTPVEPTPPSLPRHQRQPRVPNHVQPTPEAPKTTGQMAM